jgi:hypothetical protein
VTADAAELAADAADRRAALAAAVDLASHRDDVHVRDGEAEPFHWLSLADSAYRWLRDRPSVPAATPADLAVISGQLGNIDTKLEKIMSEDAAVQAVTADIQAQVTALTAATAASTTAVNAVLTEIADGSLTVQPSTLAALQAADAALDTANSANTAAVAAETSESQPPAS